MILASRARMPLAALAFLDRDGAGVAVHDLHQAAGVADEVGAFLDGGAVGGSARADRRLRRRSSASARRTLPTR